MRTLKLLLLVLALSLPAWGITNAGFSAPIQGVGVANTDCPAAIAASGAVLNGGTNGKAVALQLPTWASSADVNISGTFAATWGTWGSTDGIAYRAIVGLYSGNYSTVNASTVNTDLNLQATAIRYACVILSAYTSGTVVVTIEPRASSSTFYPLLSPGSSNGGVSAASGSALNQGGNTSSNGLLTVAAADKAVVHQPVAATTASASAGAGGAAIRHIATSCTVYISTVAAQPDITVNLRDGGPSAGTIIWSGRVSCAITSGDQCKAQSPPLNILGSANTAMTCETATAPAAGNFATATLTYHDAG